MDYSAVASRSGILKFMYYVDHYLQKILKFIALFNLATVVIIVFLQITVRSITGFSFRWVDEFARWTNIYSAMCGGALCYRYRGLTGFSSVVDRLSSKAQTVIRYVNDVIISLFCICTLIGAKKLLTVVITYNQKSTVTKMPMAIPYFIIVLTFGSILIFSINMIVFGLCKVEDGNKYETENELLERKVTKK